MNIANKIAQVPAPIRGQHVLVYSCGVEVAESLCVRYYRLTCADGIRSRQGMACSNLLASRIRVASSPNLATNCTPMGKPELL